MERVHEIEARRRSNRRYALALRKIRVALKACGEIAALWHQTMGNERRGAVAQAPSQQRRPPASELAGAQ